MENSALRFSIGLNWYWNVRLEGTSRYGKDVANSVECAFAGDVLLVTSTSPVQICFHMLLNYFLTSQMAVRRVCQLTHT